MHEHAAPTSPLPEAARRWLLPAIVLSAVASGLHVLVMPAHFEEWFGYGLFFLLAAAAQGIYAALLLYRGAERRLLWVGILGNALVIGLYLVTRTVGIPFFGPEAGEVEGIGLVDVASKVVEMALITCLANLLRAAPAGRPSRA